jgi:hydroxymethylpyrimidine/phosphomethylpyrimidine kinase
VQAIVLDLVTAGAEAVVLKGGHINPTDELLTDYALSEFGFFPYVRRRVSFPGDIHGTGCVFSATLTANLLLCDGDFDEAMLKTQDDIERYFDRVITAGTRGGAVLDVGATPAELAVMHEVAQVYQFLHKTREAAALIPEVKTNISIATPEATTGAQVAAIEGRITVVGGVPQAAGPIRMGVSNHTARLLLAAKALQPAIRSVVNLKYQPEFIPKLASAGLVLSRINRHDQPSEVAGGEQHTMQWVVRRAFDALNLIPDIIWDDGEPGKEPMLRVFAGSGEQLLQKIKAILTAVTPYGA